VGGSADKLRSGSPYLLRRSRAGALLKENNMTADEARETLQTVLDSAVLDVDVDQFLDGLAALLTDRIADGLSRHIGDAADAVAAEAG